MHEKGRQKYTTTIKARADNNIIREKYKLTFRIMINKHFKNKQNNKLEKHSNQSFRAKTMQHNPLSGENT